MGKIGPRTWFAGAALAAAVTLQWAVAAGAGGATKERPRETGGGNACGFSRPGMVCVPAGTFVMGSYSGDQDEEPPHQVYLDAFLIDKYEVTMEQYDRCVRAGRCSKPRLILLGRYEKGKEPQKGSKVSVKVNPKYPVVGITWYDADAYCRSLGKRLPTEAEWEKAARGTDRRRYPWGNKPPTCTLANIDVCGAKISIVGKHPKGASPYGAQDMAGNVWEWVADWYDPRFYKKPEASRNPVGPLSPKDPVTGKLLYRYKVLRGGSYTGSPSPLWSSYRFRLLPNTRGDDIGFRCAYSPNPPGPSTTQSPSGPSSTPPDEAPMTTGHLPAGVQGASAGTPQEGGQKPAAGAGNAQTPGE